MEAKEKPSNRSMFALSIPSRQRQSLAEREWVELIGSCERRLWTWFRFFSFLSCIFQISNVPNIDSVDSVFPSGKQQVRYKTLLYSSVWNGLKRGPDF